MSHLILGIQPSICLIDLCGSDRETPAVYWIWSLLVCVALFVGGGVAPVCVCMCMHAHACKQWACTVETCLELRIHVVLVWLDENILSKWSRERGGFKTSVCYFICYQTETETSKVWVPRPQYTRMQLSIMEMQLEDQMPLWFLLPNKAVPHKEKTRA